MNKKRTLFLIFLVLLLIPGLVSIAFSGEQILHSKIKTISPEKTDGKKGIDTPGYWELFAQFYYRDVSAPEYCRYYSRSGHAFKTPGKTCLKIDGDWEVK